MEIADIMSSCLQMESFAFLSISIVLVSVSSTIRVSLTIEAKEFSDPTRIIL